MRQIFFIISAGFFTGWLVAVLLGATANACGIGKAFHISFFLAMLFFVLGLVKGKEKP
jgi:hypothetical protein